MNYNWEEIYGQESVKKILDKLISSGKIPHALLFKGISGTGKDFTALKFAQQLNNKFSLNSDVKKINHQIQNLSEPYVKYIFPLPRGKNETENDGPFDKISSNELQLIKDELAKKIANPYYKVKIPNAANIKISSIRNIKKFLGIDYSDIKFRVIIISDAHLMNEASQNALLKNLEEPPEGVIFILTTPFPDKLRETIRSRCWNVNFNPLTNSELVEVLVKCFNIERKSAESVSPFSGGSVASALNLLEHDIYLLKEKTIFILRYSLGRKYHSALNEFSTFLSENDSESIKILIQMIITWLNDTQKLKFNTGNFFFDDYKETLEKFNLKFPDVAINSVTSKLDKLSSIIDNNVNLNIIIFNIVFLLSSIILKETSES